MNTQLKGKKALVTGSTAGIGFAVAKQLLQEGAHVYINGRTSKRVEETLVKLKELVPGAHVEGVAADFTVVSEIDHLLAKIPRVDILVNNVGIFEPKEFTDIPDADWLNMFEVNVLSGVRLSRKYLPLMLESDWGRIVFMSSESGINIPKEMIHYGMTKTAMLALSSGLAVLTKGTAVTVNAVLPGPTASEGVDTFMGNLAKAEKISMSEMEERFFEVARPTSLIQRFATPDEIANLVTYVCSPLSAATNGASLRVDGGIVRSII